MSTFSFFFFFFFNDTATTEIYTLSLHDALPIYRPYPAEHRMPHGTRELPRVGVLTARVVRCHEDGAVREPRLRVVSEPRALARREPLPPSRRVEPGIVRDAAQRHDDAHALEQAQLGREIGPAALELGATRLVAGRRAARRSGDVAVPQLEAIGPRNGVRPARESEAVQRLVQPVAARVPREHPAGAVRAVRRGRQAHDQEPRARVTEGGDGPTPIVPLGELGLLIPCYAPAVGAESEAPRAGDDGAVDRRERAKRVAAMRQ